MNKRSTQVNNLSRAEKEKMTNLSRADKERIK